MMFSNRRALTLTGVIAVAAAFTIGVGAQAPSPLNGTWKLNVAKSTYSPAALAGKSGTTKIEVTADGIKLTNDGVDGQGRAVHTEYTAKLDGKDYPIKALLDGKPSPNQDSVAWKKIDDYTYESTAKLKGKTLTTSHLVISKDGKSRTLAVTGTNAQGQAIKHSVVYDKQ